MLATLFCLIGLGGPSVFVAGEYRVDIWSGEEEQELQLKDRDGRLVTSLRDYRTSLLGIYDTRPEAYGDLTGDGVEEIVFETWTGGAHGGNTYQVWSLGKVPRCLLAYDKGNVFDEDDFEFRDLDGDGVREIVSWYDGFAYADFKGFFNAYAVMLPMVLRYEEGRYRERTREYPQVTAPYLDRYRSYLHEEEAHRNVHGAVGLYALAVMRNTRSTTLAYLRKELPSQTYKQLLKDRGRIEKITRGRADRLRYPRAYGKE